MQLMRMQENEIDTNLDQLAAGAGRLNQLSRAMGSEVDEQVSFAVADASKLKSRCVC